MKFKKSILKYLLTVVLFLLMAVSAWAAQTPNNTNAGKPVITYVVANETQIDINGSNLHQNGVAQVILGRNNASTIGIDFDLTIDFAATDGKQLIVNLPTPPPDIMDGTHLLTVITSKGSDEFSFTIGAVGPEGPEGVEGAPGTDGQDGANGRPRRSGENWLNG